MTAALLATLAPSLISAGGAVASSVLGRQKNKPTDSQKRKEDILNLIMQGVQGEGSLANLFGSDQEAFQKSFVDPAMSRFKNQTAPQIQQSFIQHGQQRGTGLEDSLTRAGVDMDTLLNQQYGQFQEAGLKRQMQGLGLGLGAETGEQPNVSAGTAAMQGLGGFFGSKQFGRGIDDIFNNLGRKGFQQSAQQQAPAPRALS